MGQASREGVGYPLSDVPDWVGVQVETDWAPDKHGSRPWPQNFSELLQEVAGDEKATWSPGGNRFHN